VSLLDHFREKKPTPRGFAEDLHKILVEDRFNDDLAQTFEIPPERVQAFRERVARYRQAVILMRLLTEAHNRKGAEEVLRAYEAIVFGARPTTIGIRNVEALKVAMVDLNRLVDPEGKPREFDWARAWFAEIGQDSYNPVTNFLLATRWMDEYIGTAKAIRECIDALF